MNDLSGIRALGHLLASARKPKVWTKRDLLTVTTGELEAMPIEDQRSWGRAIAAHWQGLDIEKMQRETQADATEEAEGDWTR